MEPSTPTRRKTDRMEQMKREQPAEYAERVVREALASLEANPALNP